MKELELDCSEDHEVIDWAINEVGEITDAAEIFDMCASLGWL